MIQTLLDLWQLSKLLICSPEQFRNMELAPLHSKHTLCSLIFIEIYFICEEFGTGVHKITVNRSGRIQGKFKLTKSKNMTTSTWILYFKRNSESASLCTKWR